MPSLTDPAAVERAERAVKQLDRKKQDLLKEKVALTSSIKMKEERLAEMLQTLSIIEEDERKSGEELRESNRLHTGFRGLESMYLVEEKMLRTGCRMASNSASMNFGKVLTRFAVQEKAATVYCGFGKRHRRVTESVVPFLAPWDHWVAR